MKLHLWFINSDFSSDLVFKSSIFISKIVSLFFSNVYTFAISIDTCLQVCLSLSISSPVFSLIAPVLGLGFFLLSPGLVGQLS